MVKSINSNVACRFFARTPSSNLRMVNVCEVVDLFLRKPFWFFLKMLSILGSTRFRSRADLHITQLKKTFLIIARISMISMHRIYHYFFLKKLKRHNFTKEIEGCPRGVMVKAMDCGIVVREFVLQSHNYVHFRAKV